MKLSAFSLSVVVAGFLVSTATIPAAQAQNRSYARVEAAFVLPNLTSDPFDYEKTDVRVQIQTPDKKMVSVPAFFDGGTTWRVRYTPVSSGQYKIAAITLNGQPAAVQITTPQEWSVTGKAGAGFVRIDKKNPRRFAFDNGTRYYPVGHNVAWKNPNDPTVPEMFARMGAAGENWSRVWMDHWDDKNLDWPSKYTSVTFGELNLDVARKWDGIVEAAEKNGIYFQPTFQHHGQISTRTDPNWDMNPYNSARGGFLNDPKEFFTNAQAKSLTKRKLRYSVARWGYSPSILAWELFNEVQFADLARDGGWDTIAAWHDEMAAFLRSQDVNKHLVATSSEIPVQVYRSMDFFQHHDYPQDLISVARDPQNKEAQAIAKPNFGGEAGMGDVQPYGMHALLWASLMSNSSGASQPWFWDVIARENLYSVFTPVQEFVKRTRLADRDHLVKTQPNVETSVLTDLVLRPRRGFNPSDQFEFAINRGGAPANFSGLSSFFPGQSTDVPPRRGGFNAPAQNGAAPPAKMTPHPLTFRVETAQPTRLNLNFGRVSANGAHIKVSVDGAAVIDQDLAASPAPQPGQGGGGFGGNNTIVSATIPIEIPAGTHTITLENSGQDGVIIRDFTFANMLKALSAYGVQDDRFAALWIYNRGQIFSPDATKTATGQVNIEGLKPGRYRAVWSDTTTGQPIRTDKVRVSAKTPTFMLTSPLILRDIAVCIEK